MDKLIPVINKLQEVLTKTKANFNLNLP
jgi:GTPase SAR1 family protein